jgi:hypothetical protein
MGLRVRVQGRRAEKNEASISPLINEAFCGIELNYTDSRLGLAQRLRHERHSNFMTSNRVVVELNPAEPTSLFLVIFPPSADGSS